MHDLLLCWKLQCEAAWIHNWVFFFSFFFVKITINLWFLKIYVFNSNQLCSFKMLAETKTFSVWIQPCEIRAICIVFVLIEMEMQWKRCSAGTLSVNRKYEGFEVVIIITQHKWGIIKTFVMCFHISLCRWGFLFFFFFFIKLPQINRDTSTSLGLCGDPAVHWTEQKQIIIGFLDNKENTKYTLQPLLWLLIPVFPSPLDFPAQFACYLLATTWFDLLHTDPTLCLWTHRTLQQKTSGNDFCVISSVKAHVCLQYVTWLDEEVRYLTYTW